MSEAFNAFVSHLECSETGEQYPANQAYNVSNAGYPLLVRYDLKALKTRLNRERYPLITGLLALFQTIAARAVEAACFAREKSARH